jgi:3-keto-disaccharide hydrolase
MRLMVTRQTIGRWCAAILGAAIAMVIGGVLDAQQAQAPAQNPPPQTAPAQRAQQPAGRGNQPDTGPVRDANNAIIGFTKLAEIPGTPWRIHDAARPHPHVITPGATPGVAPSDAIALFDGKDLSKWAHSKQGQLSDATWPVKDGYFETGAGSGSIVTREKFGDVQLHVEFATPSPGRGFSQDRGNSGVIFMGRYEVQVLDSYENVTYADGQAASIYGEYPPLVNAARKPGEWQAYDIVFEAPKFNGTTLVAPAYVTVFWNGVLVQHRRPVMGSTSATTTQHAYAPHDPELPLTLQDHSHPVHYRNIWIRRLAAYDLLEK